VASEEAAVSKPVALDSLRTNAIDVMTSDDEPEITSLRACWDRPTLFGCSAEPLIPDSECHRQVDNQGLTEDGYVSVWTEIDPPVEFRVFSQSYKLLALQFIRESGHLLNVTSDIVSNLLGD
jgi:hypothetical protein